MYTRGFFPLFDVSRMQKISNSCRVCFCEQSQAINKFYIEYRITFDKKRKYFLRKLLRKELMSNCDGFRKAGVKIWDLKLKFLVPVPR